MLHFMTALLKPCHLFVKCNWQNDQHKNGILFALEMKQSMTGENTRLETAVFKEAMQELAI